MRGEIEAAYEAYLDSQAEPPFSEDHHRYHTPGNPPADCPNCRWLGWTGDSDLAAFTAGWLAREALR